MYIGIHVKHPLFLSDFNQTSVLSVDFQNLLQMLNDLSSGSRLVLCGQTHRHDYVSCFSHFLQTQLKSMCQNIPKKS